MSEKHVNRKILYTKRVIRESFLEILQKKPLNKITVKEIAERADINRATFYAHYDNIDVLIAEIELEMAQEILDSLQYLYQDTNYEEEIINALFSTMVDNKENICMWFVDDKTTGKGRALIYEHARKICIPEWKRNREGLTDEQAEWFLRFIYDGAMGYLKKWYEGGCIGNIGEIKSQFQDIVHSTLSYIYG